MNFIHETCVIAESAIIGEGNHFGPYCIVGENVTIGDGNEFVAHVCIGTPGQYRGEKSRGGVKIGNRNKFHEFSQVHQAMKGVTTVGDDGYFMKGAHIAHDCQIGNGVTMCNDAALGGGTIVDDGATLGLLAAVHQGQRIGAYSMLGMGAVVTKNAEILPGEVYAGNPARHVGRNIVGLERNGIDRDALKQYTDKFTEENEKPEPPRTYVKGDCAKVTEMLQTYMQTRDVAYRPYSLELMGQASRFVAYLSEDDAANMYNMAFALAWQLHNDFRGDQLIIRELLIERMGAIPPADKKPRGKVAWLLNHVSIGTYAPYKHVHAYLSGMEPCPIYVFGSIRDKEAGELKDLGHEIYHFKGPASAVADAIAEQCKKDNVGALITDIYTSIPLMVFKRRAAPLQVYLSPGFQLFPADLVLLAETQDVISHARHNTDYIPTCVLPEHLYKEMPNKSPSAFGVLTRAEKMSEAYLRTVGKICDKTGAEFHIYGRGEPCWRHPKFKTMGIKNAHEALSNIKVYLDTWPTCGGLSCFEAMAHGVPVITLDHPSVSSWNLFKPSVHQTEDEFIASAMRAYTDSVYSAQIATEGRETVSSRITNIPRAVSGLYKALRRAGWEP